MNEYPLQRVQGLIHGHSANPGGTLEIDQRVAARTAQDAAALALKVAQWSSETAIAWEGQPRITPLPDNIPCWYVHQLWPNRWTASIGEEHNSFHLEVEVYESDKPEHYTADSYATPPLGPIALYSEADHLIAATTQETADITAQRIAVQRMRRLLSQWLTALDILDPSGP